MPCANFHSGLDAPDTVQRLRRLRGRGIRPNWCNVECRRDVGNLSGVGNGHMVSNQSAGVYGGLCAFRGLVLARAEKRGLLAHLGRRLSPDNGDGARSDNDFAGFPMVALLLFPRHVGDICPDGDGLGHHVGPYGHG
jgi:hypothetical protein